MALTDLEIRSAKPRAYLAKLSDGGGLQLWISPDGAKRRRLARLLARGRDPSVEKRLSKAAKAAASANTFGAVARELLNKKHLEGKAQLTIDKLEWLLGLAQPIDCRPAAEIKAAEILHVLREVEPKGKHETAWKLRAFIGQVLRYAVSPGRAETDPTAVLRGALIVPKI